MRCSWHCLALPLVVVLIFKTFQEWDELGNGIEFKGIELHNKIQDYWRTWEPNHADMQAQQRKDMLASSDLSASQDTEPEKHKEQSRMHGRGFEGQNDTNSTQQTRGIQQDVTERGVVGDRAKGPDRLGNGVGGKGADGDKNCTVAVATVIKNENHGLVEWMEHYLGEGICHFYFLSNDLKGTANRETFLSLIKPYADKGMVTEFHHDRETRNLNVRQWTFSIPVRAMSLIVLAAARKDMIAEWLIIVDMDEYMYAQSSMTMAEYLDTLPPHVDQICMPGRTFGTSGFKFQPSCIVPFFTHRQRFTGFRRIGKCVVRIDRVNHLSVHMHPLLPNATRPANNATQPAMAGHPIIDGVSTRTFAGTKGSKAVPQPGWNVWKKDMPEWPLAYNHYQAQSFEQFYRKRTGPSPRTGNAVNEVDQDFVIDDFLRNKSHWKRAAMPECTTEHGPVQFKDPLNMTAFEAWYEFQIRSVQNLSAVQDAEPQKLKEQSRMHGRGFEGQNDTNSTQQTRGIQQDVTERGVVGDRAKGPDRLGNGVGGKGADGDKNCTVAVATVIKNENHGLVEWMEHYLGEGICHFYFLSNDLKGTANRETFLSLIKPYADKGMVTEFHHDFETRDLNVKKWTYSIPIKAMTLIVLAAAKKDMIAEWLIIVDMDEYMYAQSSMTMAEYLDTLPPHVDQICMPGRTFGTSGFKFQPSCIVPFFTHRQRFTGFRRIGKCVVRIDRVNHLSVHMHPLLPNATRPANNATQPATAGHPIIDGVSTRTFAGTKGSKAVPQPGWNVWEKDMPEWPLAYNHYQAQSFEQFYRKRTGPSPRTGNAVNEVDRDFVIDDFLRNKSHWKRAAMPECTTEHGPVQFKDPLNMTAFEAWYEFQIKSVQHNNTA